MSETNTDETQNDQKGRVAIISALAGAGGIAALANQSTGQVGGAVGSLGTPSNVSADANIDQFNMLPVTSNPPSVDYGTMIFRGDK